MINAISTTLTGQQKPVQTSLAYIWHTNTFLIPLTSLVSQLSAHEQCWYCALIACSDKLYESCYSVLQYVVQNSNTLVLYYCEYCSMDGYPFTEQGNKHIMYCTVMAVLVENDGLRHLVVHTSLLPITTWYYNRYITLCTERSIDVLPSSRLAWNFSSSPLGGQRITDSSRTGYVRSPWRPA
jgi:hypothetical protein